MLVSFSHRRFGQFHRFVGSGGSDVRRRWIARGGIAAVAAVIAVILQSVLVAITPAYAATPLNVFVGYMDTHSTASSTKQPRPWPYTDPTSYVGSPCPAYPNSTTCWDAAAVRLDNPGSVDVTGVQPVVVIGSHTYNFWGTSATVKAHGTLVLTETGGQNSTNFDATDFSPNAYNGGNTASCVNSGAIPDVRITIGGATTSYLDSGQVLNGGGVDAGHCVNGAFVSGRLDESHPWAQIGTAAATTPTAPRSLAAVGADGSVSLSWTAPTSDGGSAVTGYNIYRGTSAGGEGALPIATNVVASNYTDTGRVNGTTYFYTVSAVNAVGVSPRSNETSATPRAALPTAPAVPTGLAAVAGNASVALSWTAPTSNGGSPITGYNIYRGQTPGGESATPIATNVPGTSFTDTGEVNGSPYYYKVAAVNAVGTSPQSSEVSATPRATVASAPLGLVASAADGSVALAWQMPTSDGGSGITSYNVYRGTSAGGEGATPIATNVALRTFTDSTVSNGTAYFYKVAAVNAVGPSPQSNEASATPRAATAAPSAPQSLAATATNATVALTWSAPASNGGSAITGYNVYRGTTTGGESLTPVASNVSGTGFTDTGLSNGTAYFYKVAAVNGVGTSPLSNEATATPSASVPSAPTGLVASAGVGSVVLAWSAPASNGGSVVTGYNVYRGTTAGGEALAPVASNVTGTGFTDTGLSNGTTYFYKVAAVNAVGPSVLSNEASATPAAAVTVPSAPTGLTGTAGNGSVVLAWSAPASNGGSAVTGYNVYRGTTTGGEALAPVASNVTGTGFTDTGLSNGTTYFYKVAAVNAVGPSVLSNEASATPAAAVTVPSAPTGLTGAAGNGSVVLAWSAPASNGGSVVTGYNVYRGTTTGGEALAPVASNVTGTGFTDTGLSNGTTYFYKVAAVNAVGPSAQSNEASATPAAASTVPSAPTGLVASGGAGSVVLTWSAPASNGGSVVTGYNVYRGNDHGW